MVPGLQMTRWMRDAVFRHLEGASLLSDLVIRILTGFGKIQLRHLCAATIVDASCSMYKIMSFL